MIISEAFAQTGAASQPNALMGMLPFILIFAAFYFFMLRPQNQRIKAHRELVDNLRRGDKIIIESGIYATITKVVDEEKIEIEIAKDVVVTLNRGSVAHLVNKSSEDKSEKSDKKESKKAKK